MARDTKESILTAAPEMFSQKESIRVKLYFLLLSAIVNMPKERTRNAMDGYRTGAAAERK